MKKYKKKKPTNEILDLDDLEGFDELSGLIDETPAKKAEEKKDKDEDEELDVNSIKVVVERIEGGLIGSLRIINEINKPIFKVNDIVHLRTPAKVQISDFVLYKSHEEYYLRRIIKYKDDNIYVAGDNEKQYHIIKKDDIVGKVVGRQRKNKFLSMALKKKNHLYTFTKVKLAYFRLGDRVLDYEGEINNEALEIAMQTLHEQEAVAEKPVEYKYDIDLDSDLESFLNPDVLVDQLEEARAAEEADALVEEYIEYSEDEYEDEESEDEEYEESEDGEESEETDSDDEDIVE